MMTMIFLSASLFAATSQWFCFSRLNYIFLLSLFSFLSLITPLLHSERHECRGYVSE